MSSLLICCELFCSVQFCLVKSVFAFFFRLLLSQFNFGLHQFYSCFIFCRFHYRKLSFRVNVVENSFLLLLLDCLCNIAVADGVIVCVLFRGGFMNNIEFAGGENGIAANSARAYSVYREWIDAYTETIGSNDKCFNSNHLLNASKHQAKSAEALTHSSLLSVSFGGFAPCFSSACSSVPSSALIFFFCFLCCFYCLLAVYISA